MTTASPVIRLPCTPVNYVSPLQRRRRGAAGGGGDLASVSTAKRGSPAIHSGPGVMLEINDDEAEKRERRLSKVLEMQQRNLASPITPADRRRSLPLSGLTNAQLAEHYADCIKLSTENKISAKNAFALHLIDYMSELFKKKEATDFQLASSTLDASAKIYAGRVDAIHSEMYKVLSGLGRGNSDSQKSPDDDDAENDADRENGVDADAGESADSKDKKRKRARKSQTVETNLKNITLSKFDLDFEMDPAYQKMPSATDEGGTGSLLLNHLPCYGDNSELILDYSTVVGADDGIHGDGSRHSITKSIDIRLLRETCGAPGFESLQICPAFADFEFMNWSADGTGSSEDLVKAAFDRLGRNVHQFDLDAEPEPVPDMETGVSGGGGAAGDNFIDDGFGPVDDDYGDDYDNDNKTMIEGNMAKSSGGAMIAAAGKGKEAELLETAIANIRNGEIGNLINVLASEPSDYSYFKTDLMRTWAGPEHWKLQPKLKDAASVAGSDKPKKSVKVKEPFSVKMEEDIADLEWNFKVTKAATTVTKVTLEKHSKQQTTLPDDLHYDAKQLMKLFSMPSVMVKWQLNNASIVEVDKYNYDNTNDKFNFCPGAQTDELGGAGGNAYDGGGDGDDDNGADNDEGPCGLDFNLTAGDDDTQSNYVTSQGLDATSAADATCFGADNLLAVPRKIAKIDIDYAKVAKRIDVKRLKLSMWEVISESCGGGKTPRDSTTPKRPATDGQLTFQSLLDKLVERIPKPMAKNLSIPIAFVCLLHLANDKTLKITNAEQMLTDVNIAIG